MTTHATLSPSARHRWQLCPGSVRETRALPPTARKSTPSSIDGTHSHTLLEYCLTQGINSARTLIGTELSDHEGSFTIDSDRAARVQVALNYVDENSDDGDLVLSERPVDPVALTGRNDMMGTVDITIVRANGIEVIDYKDGLEPVDVKNNPQLEQYAVGVLANSGSVMEQRLDTPVRMTVIQPKLAFKGLPMISSWDTMASRLISEVVPKMIEEVKATDDPEAPLVPGDVQCKYCPAKPCRAMAAQSVEAIGMLFAPTSNAAPVDTALDIAAANRDPSKMSADELDQLLDAAPLLRQLIDAAEAEGQARLEAGRSDAPKGRKLVNGRGSRHWSIPEDQVVEKLVKMGVPKSSTHVSKVVSPAQIEKLTWEKRDGTKVSLSPVQLRRLDAEYVSKVVGKPTMVPISDGRPAVVTSVAPMFSAIASAQLEPVTSLPSWLTLPT